MSISVILLNFLILLLNLLITYSVGYIFHLLAKSEDDKPWRSLFMNFLIGFILISTIFSFVKTGGFTVQLGLILLLLVFLFLQRGENRKKPMKLLPNIDKKIILTVILISAFVFILGLQWFFNFKTGTRYTLANDILFWARLSEHLRFNAVENGSFSYFNPEIDFVEPYHWVELWHSAFNIQLFGQPSSYALVLNTYALMSIILVVGGLSIAEIFNKPSILVISISPAILFTAGYYLKFYYATPSFNALNSPKYLSVMLLFVASVIYYSSNRILYAILMIASMGLCYIVTLPSIFIAASLSVLLLYFFKEISLKTVISSLTILCASVFFIILFYFIVNKAKSDAINSVGTIGYIKSYIEVNGWIDILKKISVTSFKFIGNWIFFGILLIVLYVKEKLGKLSFINFLIFLFFVTVPAVIWAFMQWHPEGHQLQTVVFHSLLSVANFTIIVYLLSFKQTFLNVVAISLIVYVFIVQPERVLYAMKKEINEVQFERVRLFISQKYSPVAFAQIKHGNDNTSAFFQGNSELTLYGIEFVSQIVCTPFIVPTITVNDIVLPDDPFLRQSFQESIKNKSYNFYLKKNKLIDTQASRLQFVQDNKISFLFFGDKSLVNDYESCIIDTLHIDQKIVLARTIF